MKSEAMDVYRRFKDPEQEQEITVALMGPLAKKMGTYAFNRDRKAPKQETALVPSAGMQQQQMMQQMMMMQQQQQQRSFCPQRFAPYPPTPQIDVAKIKAEIRNEMKIEQLEKQVKEQNEINAMLMMQQQMRSPWQSQMPNTTPPQLPFSGSITKTQTLTLTQNNEK